MKRLIVLGGGESGFGAAVLGKAKGMEVFVSDSGTIPSHYADEMRRRGIEFEEGKHTENRILAADVVVKSPGIPPTVPIIQKLISKNVPIVSEIEFAGWHTDAKMVCITGSNGKTTTTLLLHHILTQAGIDAGLAGNVGKSLAFQVAEQPHDVYVIELSSFQLENMYRFHANIAVVLNITPDHLDRYDHKMENYARAKFRILRNQTSDDWFIYWNEDPIIAAQISQHQIEARCLPFSATAEEGTTAYPDGDVVRIITPCDVWEIPRSDISLPGLHNMFNSMAAALSATALGIDHKDICRGLSNFEAVEHRLEYVATIDNVRYINDSKATNVNSTWYALESMQTPVVLILGGKDKGNDYSEIEEFVRAKVKAIICMGKDNNKLLDFFRDKVPAISDTHSLDEAIEEARNHAAAGDTVLLSPCCASFDLFKSYEDRGQQFKNAVRALSGIQSK